MATVNLGTLYGRSHNYAYDVVVFENIFCMEEECEKFCLVKVET
jgi:hypothetical protein